MKKKYGKKITLKTTTEVIGDFQKINSPEKRWRIEEIVRQELSPEFSGLSSVYHFVEFSNRIKTQEYITPDESIFFSFFEKKKIKEIASLFNKNKNLTISSVFQSLRRIEELTESKYNNEIREFLKLYKPTFLNGIKNENLAKTTSGLVELSKCALKDYTDELLYDARNVVLNKIRQLNGDKILKAKIFPVVQHAEKANAQIGTFGFCRPSIQPQKTKRAYFFAYARTE